jgi:hypothetical protein
MAAIPPADHPLSPGAGISSSTASSRHRLVGVGLAVAVVVVLVVAVYASLLGAPSLGNLIGGPNPDPDSGQIAPENTQPGCTQPTMATALLIPNSNPAKSVTVGDHVGVTFEFNVTFATVPVAGLKVYTPTVFVTMPTVGGGSFPVTFTNHSFTMSGPQWTPLSYNKLVTSAFTFNSAKNASLSTQLIGTMADTPYGTLKLEWRWSWTVTTPNGTTQGPWTVPTSTTQKGVWNPSIFEPAPYVDLVSESPANDLIGSNYTMYLGGDVAGRSFYIEIESQTGVVWAVQWVNDTSNTNATFEGNFTLIGHAGYLYPGLYIIHIHDSCIALLYSKRVTLAYPPTATIQFLTTPSNCGTITFNGTVYLNGQHATVVPSPNPYPYSRQPCKGFVSSKIILEGAIYVSVPGQMVVSANGTFIQSYRPVAPVITVTPNQGPVGATVTVSGTGFSVSSTVGLVFDGVTITSCTTGSLNASGSWESFSCTFAVPIGTSGTSVVATNVSGQKATGTFIVTTPKINMSPNEGPVGATVTVSGTGFSVSSTVGLVFDKVSIANCTAGSLMTGPTGAFSCTFAVPSGTSGTSVVATDVGGWTGTGGFWVKTPKITASPDLGPVGATVTVSGTGFSVSSTVGLVFDRVTITRCSSGSLTTTGTGSFSCTFAVPSGTSGTSVVATDVGGQTAAAGFWVKTPKITVSPTQDPVGATVTVSGTGFSVSSTVGLVFDGVTITNCTSGSLMTGATGSFSCTFAVPSGTSGTSVVATDVGGQAAIGTFKVTTS